MCAKCVLIYIYFKIVMFLFLCITVLPINTAQHKT